MEATTKHALLSPERLQTIRDGLSRPPERNPYVTEYGVGADIADELLDHVDALAAQLAAAEARATEAAAEAGKWQQRHGELQQELAEQERDKLALVQKLAAVKEQLRQIDGPFTARERLENEINTAENSFGYGSYRDGLLSERLVRLRAELAAMESAPAPVAPQQQEGGGQ